MRNNLQSVLINRIVVVMVAAFAACPFIGPTISVAQTPATAPTDSSTGDSSTGEPTTTEPAELGVIRSGSEKFVSAFNQHDAKAIAALWTESGEYVDDSGRMIAGRDAIEQDYAAFFDENPTAEIQIAIDSLRLVSNVVAIEDGRAIVHPAPDGAPGVSKYTAVHVKIDDTWTMASVRDTWIEAQVTHQSVADLDWLIGTWVAEEHGVKNESECSWVADQSFVERRFTTTHIDGTTTSGVQLIGWNPLTRNVQSWTFSPGGGHDVGLWMPVHNGWQAEMRGVTVEGTPTTSVNLLRRLDDDAYVWQSFQRSVGGVSLPDTDEVVVKRQANLDSSEPTER